MLRGAWHLNFHCWIVSRAARSVLFQKRSEMKDSYPGMLDSTIGGHFKAGESAGRRTRVPRRGRRGGRPGDFISLGRRLDIGLFQRSVEREIACFFFLPLDIALEEYRLDPQESERDVSIPVSSGLPALLWQGRVGTRKGSEVGQAREARGDLDATGRRGLCTQGRFILSDALHNGGEAPRKEESSSSLPILSLERGDVRESLVRGRIGRRRWLSRRRRRGRRSYPDRGDGHHLSYHVAHSYRVPDVD
jgi:hypothetical protein